jgi:hypothetical protein
MPRKCRSPTSKLGAKKMGAYASQNHMQTKLQRTLYAIFVAAPAVLSGHPAEDIFDVISTKPNETENA